MVRERAGVKPIAALLFVLTAIVGLVLLRAQPQPMVGGQATPVLALLGVGLVLMYAAGELTVLQVEVRGSALGIHLSGVSVVLAILLLPPVGAVAVAMTGAGFVAALQHPKHIKAAVNLCLAATKAVTAVFALQLMAQASDHLTTAIGIAVLLADVISELVTAACLMAVLKLHGSPVPIHAATGVAGAAALASAAAGIAALTLILLVSSGPLGITIVALTAPAILLVRRAFVVLHRRHQSLELVHAFVAEGRGALSQSELAGRLLDQMRTLLRASWIELVPAPGYGGPSMRVTDDGPLPHMLTRTDSTPDWVATRAMVDGAAVLVPRRSRDKALRRWADLHEVRDAIVVPVLDGESTLGVLTVADRLGDSVTFTTTDLELAQTLSAHLAVALRSAGLVEQLRHDANHDALTQLANRAMLDDQLTALSAVPPSLLDGEPARVAMLLLDLNRFKDVNDTLGHSTGDKLLVVVGQRLAQLAPPGALVARLGGDEFAILLPQLGPDRRAAEASATSVATQAAAALRVPVALDDHVVTADACIGVSVSRRGASDCADLLRQADLAMYAAKSGGQPWALFSPELDKGRAERLALVADLQTAMAADQLSVDYQPLLGLADRQIRGVEALVRWRHPQHGWVPPDVFVPLAESTGLIGDLLRTVLGTALRQCRAWRDEGYDLSVSVNLSARNLNDDSLLAMVSQALNDVGLPAEVLVLEITESSVMGDPDATLPVLKALVGLGVRLSLDDFGTGYSSLSYLQALPVQEVKIDRSFVQGMTGAGVPHLPGVRDAADGRGRAELLVRAIIDLASGLGLEVVAEGIEDQRTLTALEQLGCHTVQGYFISRPATPDGLSTLLSTRARRLPGKGPLRVVGGTAGCLPGC